MDKSLELFLCVHGFGGSVYDFDETKYQLLDKGYNVILAEWERGARYSFSSLPFLRYDLAAANTRVMGAIIAAVLRRLVDHSKIDLEKTTIIGFSLGAHVAGFAGSRLPGLKRIIGLDPAGPRFRSKSKGGRLDSANAKLVQVIHTSDSYIAGTSESLGHIDFFANGGKRQPGCKKGAPQVFQHIREKDYAEIFSCSHMKAVEYFAALVKQGTENKCNPPPGLLTDAGSGHRGRFFYTTSKDGGCEDV